MIYEGDSKRAQKEAAWRWAKQRVVIGWDMARETDRTMYCVMEKTESGRVVHHIGSDAAEARAIAAQIIARVRRKEFRVIEGGLQST